MKHNHNSCKTDMSVHKSQTCEYCITDLSTYLSVGRQSNRLTNDEWEMIILLSLLNKAKENKVQRKLKVQTRKNVLLYCCRSSFTTALTRNSKRQ